MKKLVLLIALLYIVPFSGIAQKDKAADKLLATVSARYKKFKSIKADFSYTIESKMDKAQEKQNGIIWVKGNKFKLDIAGQLIVCDNSTIWTYSKEVNELQINTYNPKQATVRLDDIFTMYDKGFLYKMLEEKKDSGKEIAIVELTPKDKKKSFYKIKITVDKVNQSIIKSIIYDKSGNIHTYVITNQVPNIKLNEKFFTLDPKSYKEVEIIDLRN